MLRLAFLLLILMGLLPAGAEAQAGDRDPNLVPLPGQYALDRGHFRFTRHTRILTDGGGEIDRIGEYFADILRRGTHLPISAQRYEGPGLPAGTILLSTRNPDPTLPAESYELTVTPASIIVRAPDAAGVFYGVQTIRQMLPPELEKIDPGAGRSIDWIVPSIRVRDVPRYEWRGMMLDSVGHFLDRDFIERYIDLLAYHKMNVLHLRLAGEGMRRLEVTDQPHFAGSDAGYGERESESRSYYTREEVRAIVAYALGRYVTVVPEIALFGCYEAAELKPKTSGADSNAGQESGAVAEGGDVRGAASEDDCVVLEEVIAEVCSLFPSRYVYVGVSDSPEYRPHLCSRCRARLAQENLDDDKEMRSYFLNRAARLLEANGRTLIVSDTAFERGLIAGVIVLARRGPVGAIDAAQRGHDVIVSPMSLCSLDLPQFSDPEHADDAVVLTLERIYGFEPAPRDMSRQQAMHVLGAQAHLSTENISQQRIDRMAFPRLSAFAEVTWSDRSRRDWTTFQDRIQAHLRRLDALGVDYWIEPPVCDTLQRRFTDFIDVTLSTWHRDGEIRYTRDGTDPRDAGWPYVHPIRLRETTTLKAATILPSGRTSEVVEWRFVRENSAN